MRMQFFCFDLARVQLSLDVLPKGPQQIETKTQYHTSVVGPSKWRQEKYN